MVTRVSSSLSECRQRPSNQMAIRLMPFQPIPLIAPYNELRTQPTRASPLGVRTIRPVRLDERTNPNEVGPSHFQLIGHLFPALLIVSLIGTSGLAAGRVSAVGRSWQVTAKCGSVESGAAHPAVKVTIANQSGTASPRCLAHSFATSQAIDTYLTGLKLEDPGVQTIVDSQTAIP